MQGTFQGARAFNQPLEAWDVSRVTTLAVRAASPPLHPSPPDTHALCLALAYHSLCRVQGTFWGAQAFNQNLEAWDVSRYTNVGVRAASHPLSRITATASRRHGLLTLSLFLSDRLLASHLSHALLFPTVWLNRSQITFSGTNLSDCNKARIASTWSANELWSSAPQSGWNQNPAAACSPGPSYLLVVGVPVGGVVLVIVFLVVLRRRRRRFAGASTSERPAQELGSAPPPTLVIAEATHSANAPETTQDVV